jgi:hypothetical protein
MGGRAGEGECCVGIAKCESSIPRRRPLQSRRRNLQFRPERAAGTLKGYSILNSAPADFATAFKGLKKVRVPLSRS